MIPSPSPFPTSSLPPGHRPGNTRARETARRPTVLGAWFALLVGAVVVLPAPALSQDPPAPAKPAPLPKNDAAFKERVNEAIARGVAWLRRQQLPDGGFSPRRASPPRQVVGEDPAGDSALGLSALALLTLRSCRVPEDDPAVVRGFEWLRATYLDLKGRGELRNYSVALTLLALEAHRAPPQAPGPDLDRYGRSVRPAPVIPPPDLEWMRELTAWLVAAQTGAGGFGYQSPKQGWYDHSNSQYSLLALKAARRCGIPVPRKVWEKALEHFLDFQERNGPWVVRREPPPEDGDAGGDGYGSRPGPRTRPGVRDRARGWGYRDRDPATGSMTTAGVSSVVICRSELLQGGGLDPAQDHRAAQSIRDGIAWLGLHFSVEENPGPADAPMAARTWQYYYLYGLERAGVLAGVALMGAHDWYLEGAAYLLDHHHPDGGWSQVMGDVPRAPGLPEGVFSMVRSSNQQDTCFALLFLKRATFPVARGSVATAAGDEALDLSGAEALDDRAFRDLFDAVFRRYVATGPSGRKAREADFLRLGRRALKHLIVSLEDSEKAVRAAALEVLLGTTGVSQGFDPSGPEEARTEAVRAWEEWWFAKGRKLVPDVEAGRFREP